MAAYDPMQWPNPANNYTPGNTHGVTTQGVGYGNATAGSSTAGNGTAGGRTIAGRPAATPTTPGITPSAGIGNRPGTAGFSGSTPTPTTYMEGPAVDPYDAGLPGTVGGAAEGLYPRMPGKNGVMEDAQKQARGGGRGRALPELPEDLLPNMQDALARAQAAGMGPYTDPYLQQIDAMRGQLYGDYDSRYIPKIDALTDRLLNRDPFRYNWSDDPLYRQYAARYQQAAKQGMQDAMGQTAALTGGYGSSYAQAAGQQAYANQMAGLNDAAMQLYQMAAQRYDQEGQDMRSNLAALEQREAANRQNYDTDRSTWYNRQDTDLQNLLNQQAMAYQLYQDQLAREMQERQLAWDQYQYWNSLYENKYHV